MSLLDTALQYAERGWPVFPVHSSKDGRCTCRNNNCEHAGKHPHTKNGFHDATTNAEIIKGWWLQYPSANIGIATGKVSGLTVCDFDVKKGKRGQETFHQLQAEVGSLDTLTSNTPSGGFHLFFYYDADDVRNRSEIRDGLDIRGTGGYIVAPGSTTPEGEYRWHNDKPIMTLPDGLKKILVNGKSKGNGKTTSFNRASVLDGVPEGQRDEKLHSYACSLQSRGVDKAEAEILVKEAASLCKPPFDVAVALEKVERVYDKHAETHTGWSMPSDIFKRICPTAFPEGILPGDFDNYVTRLSEIMGMDRGMLAMFGIGACNAAISNRFRVKVKQHAEWIEPPIIWIGGVGDPSIKKTPALSAMTAPVEAQNSILIKKEISGKEDYKLQEAVYKNRQSKYVKALADGLPHDKPVRPVQPDIRRAVMKETTTEGLREILARTEDGTTLIVDELTGWFGSMDAYRGSGTNKDRPHWLEFYNGKPHSFDRVDRNIYVPHWGGSIIGGVQPRPMKKLAKNLQDDGLLQRFNVFLAEPATPGKDTPIEGYLQTKYETAIRTLFDLDPKVLTFSPKAAKVREDITRFVHEYQCVEVLPHKLRTHIGKWEGMFARYCLILHLIDHGYGHGLTQQIPGQVAQRVRRLFMEYLWPHALAFYADVGDNSDVMDGARWTAGYILSRSLEVLERRQLRNSYHQARHDAVLQTTIMDALNTYGWVEPVLPENYSKHITRWLVNPMVHELFKDKAEQERERRQREREKVKQAVEQYREGK